MSPEEIRQIEWYQNLEADRQSLTELGYQIVELAGHTNAAHPPRLHRTTRAGVYAADH